MKKQIIAMLMFLISSFGLTANAAIIWDITGGTESIGSGDFYDGVNIYNDASVGMDGGQVNMFSTYNSSYLEIDSGLVYSMVSFNESQAHLYGGLVDGCSISIIDTTSTIHFYGTDFIYTPSGGEHLSGFLSGKWSDGNNFDVYLRTMPAPFPSDPYLGEDFIVLHEIPEPLSIFLLGIGSLLVRTRK